MKLFLSLLSVPSFLSFSCIKLNFTQFDLFHTGSPICNGHGKCSTLDPQKCDCFDGWMGIACTEKCLNGTGRIRPDGTAVCDCDSCFSGTACDQECSNQGKCNNATCDCGFEGWRGSTCETKGCPGWGKDCTGHGDCIPSTGQCICRSGWAGRGCEIPQCPGGGNCSNHGVCDGVNYDPPQCIKCDTGYMGRGCELSCVNGNVSVGVNKETGEPSYSCICDSCYSGIACDQVCSLHGTCSNGTCNCIVGWKGDVCSQKGCPGTTIDCSGKGVCLKSESKCICYNGWKGPGCNIPDCPGTPDCNAVGQCDGTVDPPVCVNCTNGTMGIACDQPCVHGKEDTIRRGICLCDSCFEGFSCELMCNGNGHCENGTCQCKPGWKGTYCKDVDCPGEPDCSNRGACIAVPFSLPVCSCDSGFAGANCSELVCPGEPMCSNRGTCKLIADKPTCVCNHGFDGDSCQRCSANFDPPLCDKCMTNYIGYNTDCSYKCVHGRADVPGGSVCVCHNDNTLGHWNGTTCEQCVVGYALRTCTECDLVHVGQNCSVNCVRANAVYKDPLDVETRSKRPIIPRIDCMESFPNGSTTFYLGYDNQNNVNIHLYHGTGNGMIALPSPYILPGGQRGFVEGYNLKSSAVFESIDQPTKFIPGKHSKVFKIRYAHCLTRESS